MSQDVQEVCPLKCHCQHRVQPSGLFLGQWGSRPCCHILCLRGFFPPYFLLSATQSFLGSSAGWSWGGFIWLSYGKSKINLLHQEEGLVLYKHNHCCLLLLLGELVDIFQSKYFPLSLQLMPSSFLPSSSSSSSPSVWQVLFF